MSKNKPAVSSGNKESATPDYSDDTFESDGSEHAHVKDENSPAKRKRAAGPPGTQKKGHVFVKSHPYLTAQKMQNRTNGVASRLTPRDLDESARKIISARNRKIGQLESRIAELKLEVDELREENKIIKKMSYRQEKALEKVDQAQTDVPALLVRHAEEVRTLREQLRRQRESSQQEADKRKELEAQNTRLKQHLTKLRDLTQDKHLLDRSELQSQINKLETQLNDYGKKTGDLEKYIENLQKNHKHEISSTIQRNRDLTRQVKELSDQLNRIQDSNKEKEKQLELLNLYSQRLRVRNGLHTTANNTNGLPWPIMSSRVESANSSHAQTPRALRLSPRSKAKEFEARRRKAEKNKRLRPSAPRTVEEEEDVKLSPHLTQNDASQALPSDRLLYGNERSIDADRNIIYEQPKPPPPPPAATTAELSNEDEIPRLNLELELQEKAAAAAAAAATAAAEEERIKRKKQKQEEKRREQIQKEQELIARMDNERAERKRKEEEELRERLELEEAHRQEELLRQQEEDRRKKDNLLRLLAAIDDQVQEGDAIRELEKEKPKVLSSFTNPSEPLKPIATTAATILNDNIIGNGIRNYGGGGGGGTLSPPYTFSEKVEKLHQGKPTIESPVKINQNKIHEKQLMDDLFGSPRTKSPIWENDHKITTTTASAAVALTNEQGDRNSVLTTEDDIEELVL